MNSKQYKKIESYYLDVEKHLFKSDKTFLEFLNYMAEDEELLQAIGITNTDLVKFITDISIDSPRNPTDKNKLIKHSIGDDYEVLTYSLKGNQSFAKHEAVATRYIMSNYKTLKGNCSKFVIGGLLETTKNTRIYLYIND